MIKFLKKIYKYLSYKKRTFSKIKNVKKIAKMPSYYPEENRKKYIKRYIDNFKWLFKYGEINNFYNLYGMDIIDKVDINEYCDYKYFMDSRNKYNIEKNKNYNYICLLRDKYVFEKYLSTFKINTTYTVAIIKNGILFDINMDEKLNEKVIFNKNSFFIKSIDGECADGVYYVDSYQKYLKIKFKFIKGLYIVQEKLIQNDKMNILNPGCINTIRIVTVNNGKEITIFSSGLRVGTKKSGKVDNWAAGGLFVPIDHYGNLTKFGFYKPVYGTKTDIHPDTKVKFENFSIPYYNEVKELVLKIHSKLYGIHSIGFDVAITNNGPVIIEANDNWEISLMQSIKGLRKKWNNSFPDKDGEKNEK